MLGVEVLDGFRRIESDRKDGGERCVASRDESVLPYVDAFAAFRDSVRTVARTDRNKELLDLCDEVRDRVLPTLGVRIEDRNNGLPSVIKLVGR